MSEGMPERGGRRNRVRQIAQAYRTAHEIVSAAAFAGILIFGGHWLDTKYGVSPWATVAGAFLGFLLAGLSLRQLLLRLDRELSSERRKRGSKGKQAPGE